MTSIPIITACIADATASNINDENEFETQQSKTSPPWAAIIGFLATLVIVLGMI